MTDDAIKAGEISRIDEEDIRLTTGFADVFTAILIVVGFAAINALIPTLVGIPTIALAFLLGRPIVTERQFAASSIVLALTAALGAGLLIGGAVGTVGMLAAAFVSWVYWQMFKVPVSLALAWIALVAFGFSLIGVQIGLERADAAALIAGLILFALGIWYDSSDRERSTRRSDVAFWLHFAAAPALVHGLFSLVGANPWLGTPVDAPLVLGIFFVLMLVSLVIDRRPILVSSFGYVIAATASLIRAASGSEETVATAVNSALAPGIIGLFMLVLAAAWTPLRAGLLRILPDAITRMVPPPGRFAAPAERPADTPAAEKEPVRLVLGFNDFFVAIGGLTLFIGSLLFGVWLLFEPIQAGGAADLARSPRMWLPVALPALSAWLVAEYFVRIRRMAWPAIAMALAFAFAAMLAGWLAAYQLNAAELMSLNWAMFDRGDDATLPSSLVYSAFAVACGLAAIANLLFWWRHRVPISVALALAALFPLLFVDKFAGLRIGQDFAQDFWQVRLLVGGAIAFVGAMLLDRSDTARVTQRADIAFWLHILASVTLIPALASLAWTLGDNGAWLVIAGFAATVMLALVIDRRAPLALALLYAISALGHLFGTTGSSLGGLVLAGGLLMLVLKWDEVRARLVPGAAAQGV